MTSKHRVAAIRWYLTGGPLLKSTGTALWFIGVFSLSARAEQWVQNDATSDYKTLFVAATTVVVLVGALITRLLIESIIELDASQNENLAYARQVMDRYVDNRIALYPEQKDLDSTLSIEGARKRLMEIVQQCYSLFESKYGTSEDYRHRLNFEISFMTRSYTDQEITIASYANRSGTMPPSLTLRAKNKMQYSKTFAAEVYRDGRRQLIVIEDTSSPSSRFNEVYTGQRDRMKSMLINPVLDHTSDILGVLVIHVEKTSFFLESEKKYWAALLDIFAKRLALEKLRLDSAVGVPGAVAPF